MKNSVALALVCLIFALTFLAVSVAQVAPTDPQCHHDPYSAPTNAAPVSSSFHNVFAGVSLIQAQPNAADVSIILSFLVDNYTSQM